MVNFTDNRSNIKFNPQGNKWIPSEKQRALLYASCYHCIKISPLNFHRLKVDNIPNFDFKTKDPFKDGVLPDWKVVRTINNLKNKDVFNKIDHSL